MYPMIGVGVFNVMFWCGFIVGHDLGLNCMAMIFTAFLFGGVGAWGIVKLEGFESRQTRYRNHNSEDTISGRDNFNPPITAVAFSHS